jgi:hypothetical protein
MVGSKQNWAELKAENKMLKLKLDELKSAMKIADRHPVRYQAMSWIAVPLHEKQADLVTAHFDELRRYDDYRPGSDGDKNFEEIHESDVLPEYRFYLLRYATDAQGNDVSSLKVWGLLPV